MRTTEEILQGMTYEQFNIIGGRDPAFWIERMCNFDNAEQGAMIKPFHREWINLYLQHKRLCIIAATGHSKSSIFGIGIPLWKAWYNRNKSFLIVSNTRDQSTQILERLTSEISNNELLRPMDPELNKNKKGEWSKSEINTTTRYKILCKPYNANIRSYHVNDCFCDEVAQYSDHSIFIRYIMTRVTAKDGKLVAASTPISAIDLPHKLIEEHGFAGGEYLARDKNGMPVFPEIYSKERLIEIEKAMGRIDFEREYMCNVLQSENALIPPDMFLDCCDKNLDFSYVPVGVTYVGADFAYGTEKHAAYTVLTVIETDGVKFYIKRIERYKGVPTSTTVERLAELNKLYEPRAMFVDETNVGQMIMQEMRMRNMPVQGCKFSFAKRKEYLLNLRKIFEDKMLVIPWAFPARPISDMLFYEITAMFPKTTPGGMETFESAGAHDDMVMSLALALQAVPLPTNEPSRIFYSV